MVKYTSRVRRAFGRLLDEELEAFTRDRIRRGVGRGWTMDDVRDFDACVAWMRQEAGRQAGAGDQEHADQDGAGDDDQDGAGDDDQDGAGDCLFDEEASR